jgi:hypothetical protein
VAQMVEHLPKQVRGPEFNPSTMKIKKKKFLLFFNMLSVCYHGALHILLKK